MRKLGTKKLRTTGYNAQANGLTEQSNLTVKNLLSAYVNENADNWDVYTRELCFAYNTSIHTSSGFSPAHLFFGRKLNVPLNILYGTLRQDVGCSNIDFFITRMNAMYELARMNSRIRQEVAATYYVLDDELQEGTFVYVYLPRQAKKKLKHKWSGPAKITKAKHPSYEVELCKNNGLVQKWYVRNHLKRAPSEIPIESENEIENPDPVKRNSR